MEARCTLPLLGFRKRRRSTAVLRPHIRALCRARALKRWSALLTQSKSRIGANIRQRLGDANWQAFVHYAEVNYKELFVEALMPHCSRLCCSGKIGGTPCPNNAHIDLQSVTAAELGTLLPAFHMDHTYDVAHICDVWSCALPPHPASWDDGICGALVAHLLFGTEDHVLTACSTRAIWRKQIHVRCGNTHGAHQRASDFCHDLSNAHYDHVLRVADIAWPASDETEEDALLQVALNGPPGGRSLDGFFAGGGDGVGSDVQFL